MFETSLLTSLFTDPVAAEIFSDARLITAMLEVEAALARAQAKTGLIPQTAAERIEQAVREIQIDADELRRDMEKAGVPTIELVKQLRAQVGDEFGAYVHWGATSQDILDTALVLQLREVIAEIEPRLTRLIYNLAGLADQHRKTLMAGRTQSQQALPTTFGFKVAGWLAPLIRHRQRLAELKPRLLVLQLGGAVGTLASLGIDGLRVQEALAAELNLDLPLIPWHTQCDTLAEFASWLSLVTGSLGKLAQDIILMAQTEVGEVNESSDDTRGGSSTMPQKNNPIISHSIVAAAQANAGLLSTMHQALMQEHERAAHGWQLEWLTLPQMVTLTFAALNKAIFLSENLVVDVERMKANVEASHGLMLAEAVRLTLAPHVGSEAAKRLVTEAARTASAQGRHLIDVVRVAAPVELDWESLKDESNYLGMSDELISRVLAEAGPRHNPE